MVIPRIDKSLPDIATLILLDMRRVMSTPDLRASDVARNMRVGS